jgi:hypothetical protein
MELLIGRGAILVASTYKKLLATMEAVYRCKVFMDLLDPIVIKEI